MDILQDKKNGIKFISKQAEEICKSSSPSYDKTHFYKVVVSGNLKLTEDIIVYLKDNDMHHTLDWLLRRHDNSTEINPSKARFKQHFAFLCLFILNIILSPFFYVLHYLLNEFCNSNRIKISSNIKLPLAYAAFSRNISIIKFFLKQGVNITDIDDDDNNVFHYIADFSTKSPQKSIEIFDMITKFCDNIIEMKYLLIDQKNNSGYTVVEFLAKYGSETLLDLIINHPKLLKRRNFVISTDTFMIEDENYDVTDDQNAVESLDVSKYETGSFADRSSILNLISDRDVILMRIEEVYRLNKGLIAKWIELKIKQMFGRIIMFNLLDLNMTILLLLLLSNFSFALMESRLYQSEFDVYIDEIQAAANNTTTLFNPQRQAEISDRFRVEHLMSVFKRILHEDTLKIELSKMVHPDKLSNLYSIVLNESNLYNESAKFLNEVTTKCILNEKFTFFKKELYIYSSMRDIIRNFSSYVYLEYPKFFSKNGVFESIWEHNTEFIDTLFNAHFEKYYFKSTSTNKRISFKNLLCIDNVQFKRVDFLNLSFISTRREIYKSGCSYAGIEKTAFETCKECDSQKVLHEIENMFISRESFAIQASLNASLFVFFTLSYVILDLLERTTFIYLCTYNKKDFRGILKTIWSQKIPGPYLRRQIDCMTHYANLFLALFDVAFTVKETLFGITLSEFYELCQYFIIMIIVLRFIIHIYALRLLPKIGYFVITLFRMGSNLFHFSIIHFIVLLSFSAIFRIILYKPSCPLLGQEGFENLFESLFSTFKLTFGHGILDAFYSSSQVKISYVLYMIIVVLLLMNLVIAVMNNTATYILQDPMKQMLWTMEWLDEATSAEYLTNIIDLMKCCKCTNTKKRMENFIKHGYTVKGDKVLVTIFKCQNLD